MTKILTISIGKIQALVTELPADIPKVKSAIRKSPISDQKNPCLINVGKIGIEGDEQADLQVHGGIEKAVYVYPSEHYSFWKDLLVKNIHLNPEKNLDHGYFGENLTVEGFKEDRVYLGDRWHVGSAIFQVTKLREPCFKFNIKMNFKGAAKAMIQLGFSGWYLKVLQVGQISAGDQIQVEPGTREISIADQNRLLYRLKGQSNLDF
jgi:MOSC domain-containing protein YiiM